MIIKQCHIDAFGHFRDRTFDGLDRPVVTIIGPNEAGKSTFFNFLQNMLYGIYPADPYEHLYAPRDERPMAGRIAFRLDGGSEAEVRRMLAEAPTGHLLNGEDRDIGNEPVADLTHVPRDVFKTVYALTLNDMTAVGEHAWEEVQDQLLGNLSISYVRPGYEVVGWLQAAADALWRGEGASRFATLEARRRTLRSQVKEAQAQDVQLRTLHREVAEHTARLQALEEERVLLKTRRRKAERLSPVRKLLVKIATLQAEAEGLDAFHHIPEDPQGALDDARTRCAELEAELAAQEHDVAGARAAVEAVSAQDRKVLEHAADIRAHAARVEEHEALLAEVATYREDVGTLRDHINTYARDLFDAPWSAALGDALRALPQADFRQRVQAWETAAKRLDEASRQAEAAAARRRRVRRALLPWIAAVLVGAGVVAATFAPQVVLESTMELGVQVGGGLLLVLGLMQLFNVWSSNTPQQAAAPDRAALEANAATQAEAVASLLRGLPLPEARGEAPDLALATGLVELLTVVAGYDGHIEHLRTLAQRAEVNLHGAMAVVEACGLEPAASFSAMARRLQTALEEAEARHQGAEAALQTLEDHREAVAVLHAEYEQLAAKRDAMEAQLAELGGGDVAVGVTTLIQRRKAADLAVHHERTLRKEYPDWEDLQVEIDASEDEEWAQYSDEELVRMAARLETLEEELRREDTARAAKQQDLAALAGARTPAEVESELADVEAELEDVKGRRDRLQLLANVVTRADYAFRTRHQPAVLERASHYLDIFTEGRYPGLTVEQGRRLLVYERDARLPSPVLESMSQGTRDQIYLAVRFAIIDHLDQEGERLPVFLDEIFVNWDRYRRENGYRILQEMARHRQLFFFTCHAWMADELDEFLETHRVVLGEVA